MKVTSKNRKQIIHDHAQSVAESMDMGTLISFTRDTIEKNFSKLSNSNVEKIIGKYNPQVLEKASGKSY
jgi:hypothetical protein